MSNLTNCSNTNEFSIRDDVLKTIADRTRKSGISGWADKCVALNVTDMTKEVSECLLVSLAVNGLHVSLTGSEIENYLINLVKLRILQINNRLPKGIIGRDVPVPDFFRPVLSRINKFESSERALTINVEWADLELREGQFCKADGGSTDSVMEFSDLLRISRVLKASGIRHTTGLPPVLTTSDDSLFRICESPEGELLVAGADVTEVDLLVRSIIRMSFLKEIYGAARTRYISVEDLRVAWEAIASTAMS